MCRHCSVSVCVSLAFRRWSTCRNCSWFLVPMGGHRTGVCRTKSEGNGGGYEGSRAELYMAHLLPALRRIHATPGVLRRRRAIKFAADMSLAHTAGACYWSRALNLRLLGMRKRGKEESATFGGRISRSLGCNLARALRPRRHSNYRRGRFSVGKGRSVGAVRRRQIRSVDVRLRALQKLVPGGPDMEADILFRETADYVLSLQMQVHVMQSLANFCTRGSPALMPSPCDSRSNADSKIYICSKSMQQQQLLASSEQL